MLEFFNFQAPGPIPPAFGRFTSSRSSFEAPVLVFSVWRFATYSASWLPQSGKNALRLNALRLSLDWCSTGLQSPGDF